MASVPAPTTADAPMPRSTGGADSVAHPRRRDAAHAAHARPGASPP